MRGGRPKVLMLQGASSNVGKSILAAAFCRIFLQDGHRVAPFKSQNMALNSFVTLAGKEMGRAQVVQAQACRLDPDVRMNPILLKPSGAAGSQVILMGEPVGNMSFEQYIDFKEEAFDAVSQAFSELAAENEIIVIEGAGSPAEINLKSHDIANMRVAELTKAKVLLVGDIDRGGVFASLVGTMELLSPQERELVKGFLINKFRGRAELLEPALDFMAERTGRPVLGVIPYIANLSLPDEDSVEFKSAPRQAHSAHVNASVAPSCPPVVRGDYSPTTNARSAPAHSSVATRGLPVAQGDDSPTANGEGLLATCRNKVTIAIIDLPHISNFTDFDPLALEPDVTIRIVRESDAIGGVDAIILPGSKNVINDLRYLRFHGYADELKRLAHGDCTIVGICGGFQMLGKEISDPHGIESAGGTVEGLGLLNVKTSLAREKTLKQVEAIHVRSQLKVRGYEIHHGESVDGGHGNAGVFVLSDGGRDGAEADDGGIWGAYIHGVFDEDPFRRWFVNSIRQRKGLPPIDGIQAAYDIEKALDELASIVRKHVEIERIYDILDCSP